MGSRLSTVVPFDPQRGEEISPRKACRPHCPIGWSKISSREFTGNSFNYYDTRGRHFMNFDQLKTFLMVYQLGNYQKASKMLYLSQPTITHRINQLEAELEVNLLLRGKKELKLTHEGIIFMKHAENIIHSFAQMIRELELYKKTVNGKLSIACTRLYSAYIIPQILTPLINQFPNVEISMQAVLTNDAFSGLIEGLYDFAITRYSIKHPDLIFLLLREEKIFLAVPSQHPFSGMEKVSINAVLKEPLILPRKGTQLRELLDLSLSKYMTPCTVNHETDEVELIKHLVSQGSGVSFLVKSCNEMNPKPLSFVDLEEDPFPLRPTYLVYNKNTLSQEKELYIHFINELWK
jgi:DNA-binding transcriptional LysR family regulator